MNPTAMAPRELMTEDLVGSFGPEHPALPGLRLQLTLDGEQVTAAEVELGYRHRGLEKLAEGGWDAAADAARRVDPRAPLAGAAAYACAREALGGTSAPPRAAGLRVAVLELERAASHLAWIARLANLLALAPVARLAFDLHGRVRRAGARVAGPAGAGFVVAGGVAADAEGAGAALAGRLAELRPGLAALQRDLGGRAVVRRLQGLGRLAAVRAVAMGASGPALRASGVHHDARLGDSAYGQLGFEPLVQQDGDALARCAVRVAEVQRALELAERAADGLADGPIRAPALDVRPDGEAVGAVEGPRGELRALVVADGTERPRRVAFRGPSLAHAMLLPELLPGCRYADVPLLVASLDLSVEEAER